MSKSKYLTRKQLLDLFECGGIIIINGKDNWLKFKNIFFRNTNLRESIGIFATFYRIGGMNIYFSDKPEYVERVIKL